MNKRMCGTHVMPVGFSRSRFESGAEGSRVESRSLAVFSNQELLRRRQPLVDGVLEKVLEDVQVDYV